MINLILSEMQREHLEQVAELEKICFSQPWSYTSLEEELDNETAHFFVATVDDRVVGYIGVFVVSDSCFISNIAVLPDYRRQGIMRELIQTAQKLGAYRKLKYSVTVPAEPRLFRYYGRYGFEKCYKNRVVYMDRSDLIFLSRDAVKIPDSVRETMMKLTEVSAFRRDMLVDRDGFAIWDSNALRYAVSSHEHEGGHVITLSYGGDFGYAFCSEEAGTVRITEFIVKDYFASTLLYRILKSYPKAQKFVFRLPVYDAFFEKYGEVVDYAMICRNDGKSPVSITTLDGIRTPYLGLALD